MQENRAILEDEVGFEGKGKLDRVTLLFEQLSSLESLYQAEANDHLGEISWKQLQLLNYIDMCECNPTSIDLANNIDTSYQNVKHSLVILERKGLVETIPDKRDKRKVRVLLTGAGRKCIEKKNKVRDAFSSKAFSGVTEEQIDITLETLLKIKSNLKVATEITVTTYEQTQVVASDFSYREIYVGKKNRPHYQLFASTDSAFQITGINRWIIGFYEEKEDLDLEIQELEAAWQRHDKEYVVKHYSNVKYGFDGMPILDK